MVSLEVREPGDFALAIAAAKSSGAQGLIQLASPFITKHRRVLLDLLEANRLPATCELREYVVEGCLMTYSADLQAMFRSMASFVDRILKGAKPASLAIEQPREFELVINMNTARSLGLAIPRRSKLSSPRGSVTWLTGPARPAPAATPGPRRREAAQPSD